MVAAGATVPAAIIDLARREGATVRLQKIPECLYVIIDGAITDALRVALQLAYSRRTRGNPINHGPADAYFGYQGKPVPEGTEYWLLVW